MGAQTGPDATADHAKTHLSNAPNKAEVRRSLRQHRRARRDATSVSARSASAKLVAEALASFEPLASAQCIATYEPLPTEEDVSLLTEVVPATRLMVPITLADRDLSWRDVATGADLGVHGIALADVVVVPALAIGPAGERLGQGGGSYDRALVRRAAGTPVVAVVFPDEVGLEFPVEPHDQPVDGVATRDGLTLFSRP